LNQATARSSTLRTDAAVHAPPRMVGIPRLSIGSNLTQAQTGSTQLSDRRTNASKIVGCPHKRRSA